MSFGSIFLWIILEFLFHFTNFQFTSSMRTNEKMETDFEAKLIH